MRSRLLRLGLPLLVFVLFINPLTDYMGNLRQEGRSLVALFLQHYAATHR